MAESELRLIKRWNAYLPKNQVDSLPVGLRGIYVLYKHVRRTGSYNVVYVGMSAAGNHGHIRCRLKAYGRTKDRLWTHFSVFEV